MRNPLQKYADRCYHRGIQHLTPQLLMKNDILIGEQLNVVRLAKHPYYDDTAGHGWVLNSGIVKMTAVPPDQYSSSPETWSTAFIDTLSTGANQGLTGITSHCNIALRGVNASSLLFLPGLKADLVLLCAVLEVTWDWLCAGIPFVSHIPHYAVVRRIRISNQTTTGSC